MLESVTRPRHCSRNSGLVSRRGMCISVRPFLIDRNIDQHDQGRGHDVEVRRFLQALGPGPAEGFQHRCGDVMWVFDLSGQGVEGDDVVGAGGVNVDQPLADVRVDKDSSGYKQPEQVIHQEGVRVDQTTATASGDVLI
jgi:hypothetical protein